MHQIRSKGLDFGYIQFSDTFTLMFSCKHAECCLASQARLFPDNQIKSSAWQHMLLQKLCLFFNILLVVPPNMLLMLCALMTLYTITDAGFLTACWQQARCCLSSLAVHNLKKEKEKKNSHFETRGLFSKWTQSVEGRTLIYPQSQSTRGHWMFDEHASDASRTLWPAVTT